jgi:predicted dehydrogenase
MKIGIMSFAHHHAEAYIANLRAIPGVEWIGVADEDAGRAEQFAQTYNTAFFRD